MKNNIANTSLRMSAGLIDWLIYISINLIFIKNVVTASNSNIILNNILNLIIFAFFLLPLALVVLNSFLISRFGGTIGKILTGTKILDYKTEKLLSFKMAFFRNHIGYIVSGLIFWLGFIWIFKNEEKRAWHDYLANTKVIVSEKGLLLYSLLFIVVLTSISVFVLFQIATALGTANSPVMLLIEDLLSELSF